MSINKILRRAFVDILDGYSSMNFYGKIFYIKHLSHRDHLDLDELQDSFEREAINNGSYTEQTRLEYLIKEGLWSDKKEHEIEVQKRYLDGLISGRKNIALPSILQRVNQDIKEAEKKISDLISEKNELIGLTSEGYAKKKVNDHYIIRSIYKDKDLKEPYFSTFSFDDIEDEELNDVVKAYNLSIDICSDNNIKKLSIQDFYQSHYYLCEDDFVSFFGRPICNFTFFQIKLANYSRYFKSILQSVDINTLPEKIRGEPDDIVDYINVTKKGKELIDSVSSNSGGGMTSIVGATKEDLKAISNGESESGRIKLPQGNVGMDWFIKNMS
jgi:hypothetical protein